MRNFFRRFLFAWRLACNPTRLKTLSRIDDEQRALAKWSGELKDKAQKLISGLVTKVHGQGYGNPPYVDITLTMRCENIMSDAEAKQVLTESKITRCFGAGEKPDPKIYKAKSKALTEHNKKFESRL